MATIIPISTNTTIAACIQIQLGDMTGAAYLASATGLAPAPNRERVTIV